MPGLVPGIHDLRPESLKTWVAGTSPAMTILRERGPCFLGRERSVIVGRWIPALPRLKAGVGRDDRRGFAMQDARFPPRPHDERTKQQRHSFGPGQLRHRE